MRAEKDPKTGKWLIQYRYTDWQGKRRKSTKRGFKTKREAEEWLRNFLMTQTSDFDMKFDEFLKLYYADMETRLREHTMRTKKYIIELKILPYFGQKRINDIKAADIRNWQNELIKQGYSPTYLKTINNQLSAVFNYAVKYYDLKGNPCAKAGSMGKSKAEEMNFWTKEEFMQFIDSVSLLVEMGFSPLEIADRLGHEKIETTLNTYSHLYPNKRTVLAEKLDVTYREGL